MGKELLLARLGQFLSGNIRFDEKTPFLLAVSGGVDSMVMARLFLEAGLNTAIAHCNFQLRGADSDGDAAFLKAFCQLHQLPFLVRTFNTKNYAIENGVSIQMAARELRYQWFGQLMDSGDYEWLCMAHHLDDNLETVLFNLSKGSGLAGIRGMPVKNNQILRPMINVSRQDILEYAREKEIRWREDVSNERDDYHRNFIRHQVVPLLATINPGWRDTLPHTLARLRGAEGLAHRQIQQVAEQFTPVKDGFIINKSIFQAYNEEETALMLSVFLEEYGFNYFQARDIVTRMPGQPGKSFFSSTHEVLIDRDTLILGPVTESHEGEVSLSSDTKEFLLAGVKYRITTLPGDHWQLEMNDEVAQLDFNKLSFPLLLRPWKKGDVFTPLGMKGKKKLSDFMIDRKIPVKFKRQVYVALSNEDIVWVVGHQINDHFKVRKETKEVFIIRKDHD